MKLKSFFMMAGLLLVWSSAISAEEPLYAYHREVAVESAGLVKLDIPIEVLSRLSSSMDEILVLDQDGAAVPVFPYQPPPQQPSLVRTVSLTNVEHLSGEYIIEVDLGPDILRHRMISIDLPGKGLAEGVILQGSSDNSSWHILQKGSMFRMNYAGLTEKTYLEYTPTSDRYLKIYWPEAAGFPQWQKVSVADWTEKVEDFVSEGLEFKKAWGSDNERAYYLSLPPVPLEKSSLELFPKNSYPLSCRLASFSNGSWSNVSEIVLLPDGSSSVFLPQPAFSGKSLLVLNGGGYRVGEIERMRIRHVPKSIVFKAETPGVFKLYYGAIGGAPPPKPVEELKVGKEKLAAASLGPQLENQLPEIPPFDILIGGAMPRENFSTRREIMVPQAGSNLISLELPPEIYEYANEDLSDIRLDCGGRQLPYIIYSPPENVMVFEKQGASPVALKGERRSAIDIALPAENIPLDFLELTMPSQPFSRRVTLKYKAGKSAEDAVKNDWLDMDNGIWQCPAAYGISTRFAFKCWPVQSKELRIVFEDSDNAPLTSVNVVLWGSKKIIIFPRPAQKQVFLCAGAGDLPKPVYDFQKLSGIVLTRKTAEAFLGKKETDGPADKIKVFGQDLAVSKWLLLFGVLSVCMIIMFILAKSIKDVGTKNGG
jgi:hypothetical protein